MNNFIEKQSLINTTVEWNGMKADNTQKGSLSNMRNVSYVSLKRTKWNRQMLIMCSPN